MSRRPPAKRQKVSTLLSCPNPLCKYTGRFLSKHLALSVHCLSIFNLATTRTTNLADESDDDNDVVVHGDETASVDTSRHSNGTNESVTNSILDDEEELLQSGYHNDLYVETKLLKLLNDKKVHFSLFNDIVEWGKEACDLRYSFNPKRSHRQSQIGHLEKIFGLQDVRPQQIQVVLTDDPYRTIDVTSYDFCTQYLSLLRSDVFQDLNNLDVNPESPFRKYMSSTGHINCVNSGHWYHRAHKKLCVTPNDFLAPVIFTFDESVLYNQQATVAPLKMTSSLLNQTQRNKDSNWRPLCLINDLGTILSKAELQELGSTMKMQLLHKMFRAGIQSYLDARDDPRLQNITLVLGKDRRTVNIKTPCCLIIGDIQGGDKLCCRAPTYSSSVSRLCRKCNIPGNVAHDLTYPCSRISMVKVKELVEAGNEAALKEHCQYLVRSPWYEVDYGGCKFGIFSAAQPIEWLHSLDNGLIKYALNILYKERLSTKHNAKLDRLVRLFVKMPRQRLMHGGAEETMPRMLWQDGITSLTEIQAKQKVGMMLTVVALSLTRKGIKFFSTVLGTPRELRNLRGAFQILLSYRAWLHKDKFWTLGDKDAKERARDAIVENLSNFQRMWPRSQGQQWALAKMHEQKHVPDDIERHGPPMSSFSGPTEHQHISIKRDAERTSKN